MAIVEVLEIKQSQTNPDTLKNSAPEPLKPNQELKTPQPKQNRLNGS